MGLTCVFAVLPKAMESPENSLVLVSSCACTSSPITTWYLSELFTGAKIGYVYGPWTIEPVKKKASPRMTMLFPVFTIGYRLVVFNFFGILISNFISVLFRFAVIL